MWTFRDSDTEEPIKLDDPYNKVIIDHIGQREFIMNKNSIGDNGDVLDMNLIPLLENESNNIMGT